MNKKLVILILVLSLYPLASQSLSDSEIFREYDKRIDRIQTDLDYVWVLISAALVFFMQPGFMALEAGMARSKNSINVSIKNLTDFVLGVIGFWIIGFGLMFGKSHGGLFGTSDFLISIEDPWIAVFFMFQSVFVGTAATIDSGAICERAKLKQYILLSFLLSIFIYPVFGHWVWGSFLHGTDPSTGGMGWLEALGFKDFAGSSVVHSLGGWMALAGTIVVGPRLGKFQTDPVTGKPGASNTIYPGDMRFVFLGTFILFFGWFGFNCGSTLTATPDIASIALNTTLAACFGCVVSSGLSWIFHPEKKIEGTMIANGILGGLVAITAGCAFVDTFSSALIGAVAGIVVYGSSILLERVFKLDDVVGAVPVHGFCGVWGTLAVGFFIRPELLEEMTRFDQIKVQALGVLVCFGWAFGLGLLLYKLVDRFAGGVRVSMEDEICGLNVAEHGAKSTLLELANSMNELTNRGNFEDHRGIDVETGTEVGDLAEIFNKLISKISEALKESRQQQDLAEKMLRESRKQQSLAEKAQSDLKDNKQAADLLRKEYIRNTGEMVGSVISRNEEIRKMMEDTSAVTEQMFSSSSTLTETLNRMLESLTGGFSKIHEVNSMSKSASGYAVRTRDVIYELREISSEIREMIQFINDIAEKTHVLSINSAIEAARTGSRGHGFTVISKEVQQLSGQTTETAQSIGKKVEGISSTISTVVESMDNITNIIGQVDLMNNEILTIIEENENFTKLLENQSHETLSAVEHVSSDVKTMAEQVSEVSGIGQKVLGKLKEMG